MGVSEVHMLLWYIGFRETAFKEVFRYGAIQPVNNADVSVRARLSGVPGQREGLALWGWFLF